MKYWAMFFGFLFIISASPTFGQVPNTFSYQGLLTTTSGTPVLDGSYKLQFDLFTDSTGGSSFWTEVDSLVGVRRGTFSVVLGGVTALPDSFHRPLYLQVTAVSGPGIGGPVAFAPRTGLKSTPYALSLKLPFTGSGSAATFNGVFSVSNDQNGSGVSGISMAGSANVGGVSGRSVAPQGNGVYGEAVNGNGAWGVYGATDSGVGIAGVSYSKGGFGVQGYSWYQNGYGVYSYGKLRVDAPAGDTSVVLPPNSISSSEILDEPGIAQGLVVGSGIDVTDSTSPMILTSTTITIPADGYVFLQASSEAGLYNTTGPNSLCYQISDSAGGPPDYNHYACAGVIGSTSGGFATYLPVAAQRTYFKSKGTYTFYLEAFDGSPGSGTKYLWEPIFTALYFPTAYGAVNTSASPSAALTTSRQIFSGTSAAGFQQSRGVQGGTVADLRELELKSRRLQEAAQQAENDYLKAKLAKVTILHKPGK